MTDEYKIQLSLNLPPQHGGKYEKGPMLNLRANTAQELQALADEAKTKPDLAPFFGAMVPTPAAAAAGPSPVAGAGDAAATEPTEAEALAAVQKHLGPGTEEPASDALIQVAASKTGKTIEELAGISKTEAQRLIKEGK